VSPGARGAASRLVFALDVERMAEAEALVRTLAGAVGVFKVGKQLFVAEGPAVVRMVRRHGGAVFLDLKFHDIPETVARAAVEAARLGVRFLDVHAAGGEEMMACTATELRRACRRERLGRPAVLAVTVLTSLDDGDLRAVGVPGGTARQVVRLAGLARRAGMDGVVASPREIAAVRRVAGPRFLVVTPGVRPPGSAAGDQKRVLGPAEAMAAGASYLVVGRPIRDARDPRAAALAIAEDMARGRRGGRVDGRSAAVYGATGPC
jgi:orotidine-5'-phosphate decarboxylase